GSNVVTGAISGVSITLLQPSATTTVGSVTTSTPTNLTISADTTAAQTSIGAFVTALNGVLSSIQTLGGYNATTQVAGPLQGNATLQSFQTQLQNILDTVTSSKSGVASLTDLGITANAGTGVMDSNSAVLGSALSANVAGVAQLLGGTNGIATQIDKLVTQYTQAGGLLSTINQGLQTGDRK